MKPGDLVIVTSLEAQNNFVWCQALAVSTEGEFTAYSDAKIATGTPALLLSIEEINRADWSFETCAKILVNEMTCVIRLANLKIIENKDENNLPERCLSIIK